MVSSETSQTIIKASHLDLHFNRTANTISRTTMFTKVNSSSITSTLKTVCQLHQLLVATMITTIIRPHMNILLMSIALLDPLNLKPKYLILKNKNKKAVA